MPSQAEKCTTFADLHHQPDAFIIPNPWDVGSARLLQGMGFKALATTSGGFAFALGKTDGEPTLEEKLDHCRSLAAATDIPINADFEDAYAEDVSSVTRNVRALIQTGVAGCSIEDFDRQGQVLYELPEATDRLSAALEAARECTFPFMVTARAEHLLRAGRDLDEVITRLKAYEAAGADVLYSPGIGSLEDLKTITDELNKPFNMLGVTLPTATLAEFQAAGAQRISIGGVLPFLAAKPILAACEAMLEEGTFGWTAEMEPYGKVMEIMGRSGG